ncbi:carnitine o-octanoyltransferase [Plakobranchus ocellatus]|uniref:Carnitine o-octanoyltransferase n=1 Tax=Plakobranchus ocellatus TaxID=259542 RepID=A0AAV4C835_9GAST|nr:carnitine o-octanoyltransferase [Plakobranchus ocellatus]
MATVEDLMLSKDKTSFQFENDLLTLPVPDLSNTLKKYLQSVRVFVTPEEYKATEAIVEEFAKGEGQYLQQRLREYAEGKKNWLEKWWEEKNYLEVPYSATLMHMCGPGQLRDVWPARDGTQIPRAAALLHYTVKFWEYTRKELHTPAFDGQGRPLSMYQYRRIFNTFRMPGIDKDRLVESFRTEREGDCPSHVVVMCKGHIFRLEMFGEDGKILTPPEIEVQLEKIKDKSISLGPAQGVPFLTSMERNAWAKTRSRLSSLHPQNEEILQIIGESIMGVWLEDGFIGDETHLVNMSFLGSGENRWFEKSYSTAIYENGLPFANADHAVGEGLMMVYIGSYIHKKLKESGAEWKGSRHIRSLPEPKHLQFVLDEQLMQTIDKAKEDFAALRELATAELREYHKYGKNYCKQKRLHPDAVCQMAIQLAYFRVHKRIVPTYETAPLRQFYHGRTEGMRTCTEEALAWVKAMDDPTVAGSQKLKLLVRAVTKHGKDFADASELKGCDRHLLALHVISQEEGRPTPALYTDPSFAKSGGGGNYIVVASCLGFTSIIGGVLPGCKHKNSIGCFYRINDNRLTFFVTTWNANEHVTSPRFADAVCNALDSIKELVDQNGVFSKH